MRLACGTILAGGVSLEGRAWGKIRSLGYGLERDTGVLETDMMFHPAVGPTPVGQVTMDQSL